MSRVFFTSDLHHAHENLCVSLRGMSAAESTELIVKKWNSVVHKRDVVYVLGDLTMEKHSPIESLIKRLNGRIVVVGGNHDTSRCCKEYARLGITVMGVLEYKGFICTHIPIHPNELEFCRGNIHGHIHKQGVIEGFEYNPKQLGNDYYNVNVEFHDYTPVPFTEIEKHFKTIRNATKV